MRTNGRHGTINTGGQTGFQPGHWKADKPSGKIAVPEGPPASRLIKRASANLAVLNADLRALALRGVAVEVFLDQDESLDGRKVPVLILDMREP